MEHQTEYVLPKNIFCYWNGNMEFSPLVEACLNTWKSKIKGWAIHFLNEVNLHVYSSIEFIEKYYKKLDPTKFSDLLRLDLLYNFGGLWMDISTIIIKPDFLEIYYAEMLEFEYDVTVYELKKYSNSKDNPFLESWFLMAPRGSRYIKDLYIEMDRAFEMTFLDYRNNVLIPSGVNLNGVLDLKTNDTYLIIHAAVNYLIHNGNKYNINIKDACESMFKIHNDNFWEDAEISKCLAEPFDQNKLYAIKLTGWDRRNVSENNFSKVLENIKKSLS